MATDNRVGEACPYFDGDIFLDISAGNAIGSFLVQPFGEGARVFKIKVGKASIVLAAAGAAPDGARVGAFRSLKRFQAKCMRFAFAQKRQN